MVELHFREVVWTEHEHEHTQSPSEESRNDIARRRLERKLNLVLYLCCIVLKLANKILSDWSPVRSRCYLCEASIIASYKSLRFYMRCLFEIGIRNSLSSCERR